MAYTDDWETLMKGVFGPGGRFKAAPGTPAEPRQQPNSTLNDLNAALLEQQKKLDAMLKAQSAQLKTQDTAAEAALADSRRMLRDMENDGLLAKGTTDVKPEHQMEKVLYAADELTGLIGAAILMRPSRSTLDLTVQSLKKKFKDKKFAAGCSREVIQKGADLLGWELEYLMEETIKAMQEMERNAASDAL